MNGEHKGSLAFALCGSFCTFEAAVPQAARLAALGWQVLPVMSFAAAATDTRFGPAAGWKARLEVAAGRPVLAALRPGSLIVDLASAPGGTDFAAAAALGHTALLASGLPARCAPDSAGAYLAQTVLHIMEEREAVG